MFRVNPFTLDHTTLRKINFLFCQGKNISFNKDGEPSTAFYTIENLVYDEEKKKMVYQPIGNWSEKSLQLDMDAIQWPYWFQKNTTEGEINYTLIIVSLLYLAVSLFLICVAIFF